jgi:hypothetical protein
MQKRVVRVILGRYSLKNLVSTHLLQIASQGAFCDASVANRGIRQRKVAKEEQLPQRFVVA